MNRVSFLMAFSLIVFFSQAQNIRIGEWRSHHNYTEGIRSLEVKNRIYTATENGLFYVDKDDNSITTWSKVNGFSDVDISTIAYHQGADLLLIAYNSTMIDALQGNRIFSIPDIFRKTIPGKKAINHICFSDDYAYISCSFGIVVYDIEKEEIKESYTDIGSQGTQLEVYQTSIYQDTLFAATDEGVLAAALSSPNLLDNKYWSFINPISCSKLMNYNNHLYADLDGYVYTYHNGLWTVFIDSLQNTCRDMNVCYDKLIITYKSQILEINDQNQLKIHPEGGARSALLDENGSLWMSMPIYALIRKSDDKYWFYTPNGPSSKLAWDIEIFNNKAYVATGGLTFTGSPMYNNAGIHIFKDESWTNLNQGNTASFSHFRDILKIDRNPNSGELYLASYGDGVAVYRNGELVKRYDQYNSTLQANINDTNRINIRGLCFDDNSNLWISNFEADEPVSVLYADGNWESFSLGSEANRGIGEIVCDDHGQKWILLPIEGGLMVFDESIETGNPYKRLSATQGNGNLPTEVIHSLAVDHDGRIWLGSEDGIAIIYNPEDVFSGYNFDAQQVWISDGDESGYLLSSEIISVITVDGANNKWIGSKNGVWYVSEDGSEILLHFTTENSPLPTNDIKDIAVNEQNGEVFFATDYGILSYRNEAIGGSDYHKDVYAYPNPVRPGYDGPIAIRGLVTNAIVKITDIAGNVVTELNASGGQAVWDGKDLNANSVKSGVYLVFSSDEDGVETNITKILIVR
jgi:ligand-binding sensor domain-containing protein